MNHFLSSFAPYIAAGIVALVYLAIKLHKEAMLYVAEVQFFLNQKTLAFNKAKASLSVKETKISVLEQQNKELQNENFRLRKSLEVMCEDYRKRKSSLHFVESSQESSTQEHNHS